MKPIFLPFLASLYVLITLLSLLSLGSTSLTLPNIMPGLVLMWVLFFVFLSGYAIAGRNNQHIRNRRSILSKADSFILNNDYILLLMCLNMVIYSIAITKYYTGNSPIDVIDGLLSGESFYLRYQRYHKDFNLGVMRPEKVPYIMMNFLLNAFLNYIYIGILIIQKSSVRKIEQFALFISAVAYLYFGVARGTNFEMFLFGFVLFYSLLYRTFSIRDIQISKARMKRTIIAVLLLLFVMIITFLFITGRRNEILNTYHVSAEYYYDQNKLISNAIPVVGMTITRLGQYFVWGIYYTSTFLSQIVLKSADVFIAGLFPGGLSLGGMNVASQVAGLIDPSTNWMPDVLGFWESFGLIGLMVFVLFLGFISRYLSGKQISVSQISIYYIILQMFSFPLGNFIIILSANRLITIAIILLLFIDAFYSWKTRIAEDKGGNHEL